jgi:hypothetical protein
VIAPVDAAYTADWSDANIAQLVQVANDLGAAPLDLAGCWMSESQLRSHAHNPNGNAVGIFQAMPRTLGGLGYSGTWETFRGEAVAVQLNWAYHYYRPHVGKLTSPGACYLATFLPAFMSHADEPDFVLCDNTMVHTTWYVANRGLDVNGDGRITVQDLTDRIAAVCVGPRWEEFAARVYAATAEPSEPPCDDDTDVSPVTA